MYSSADFLALLKSDINKWNLWRKENIDIIPSLQYSDLERQNISFANLSGVDLSNANLSGANLSNACLSNVNLSGSNLSDCNLANSDLRTACLIDSILDNSILTGVMIWEAQKANWSIKNVICEYAFLNREGNKKTEFHKGDFESRYSENKRLILRFEDGMSNYDFTTLAAILTIIEKKSPNSLRLSRIDTDPDAVIATISIDQNLAIDNELIEILEKRTQSLIEELTHEKELRHQYEGQVQLLRELILQKKR